MARVGGAVVARVRGVREGAEKGGGTKEGDMGAGMEEDIHKLVPECRHRSCCHRLGFCTLLPHPFHYPHHNHYHILHLDTRPPQHPSGYTRVQHNTEYSYESNESTILEQGDRGARRGGFLPIVLDRQATGKGGGDAGGGKGGFGGGEGDAEGGGGEGRGEGRGGGEGDAEGRGGEGRGEGREWGAGGGGKGGSGGGKRSNSFLKTWYNSSRLVA